MIAAFCPPGPDPMTARSKSYVCSMSDSVPDRCYGRYACVSTQPAQRADRHLAIRGLPHLGHRRLEEAAVAGGDQPRVEHGHHALVGEPPDQPARALSKQQRRVGRGDTHEPVATGFGHRALARDGQRLVGAWERDPVDDHQLTGRTRHVDPLPQRQRAEQARMLVLDEAPGQLGELGVSLAEDRELRQLLAGVDRRSLGGTPRGEESERPTSGCPDQFGDLGHRGLREPVPPRRRQRSGDVEDALPAIVERRADIQGAPRHRVIVVVRRGVLASRRLLG